MSLPNKDFILIEFLLAPDRHSRVIRERKRREKLIDLIEDYFGEEDGHLVLAIALYFRWPFKYGWLYNEIVKKLEGPL